MYANSSHNNFLVLDSGKKSAQEHMQYDFALLETGTSVPFLRFYEWDEAVTYGYFIKPTEWLKKLPQNIARRPTGGGLIFHDNDFSFTLALPIECPLVNLSAQKRYGIINTQVVKAIESVIPECRLSLQMNSPVGVIDELCMANPTHYDILLGSKKVGGAAQRKNKRCFIHQCSLFLTVPSFDAIGQNLLDAPSVLPKLISFTGGLAADHKDIPVNFRTHLKASLKLYLQQILGL